MLWSKHHKAEVKTAENPIPELQPLPSARSGVPPAQDTVLQVTVMATSITVLQVTVMATSQPPE